jgi:GntR family transcriptional regulator, transcriptional repressor for pyruvate dehydrogenase complex
MASQMEVMTSSLTGTVFAAVTDHIRAHDLRTGDPLPSEATIAATVGVSRTVVREAFGALAALRLIDVGNGRRARVGAIDGSVMSLPLSHAVDTAQATIPQVWDARRALERRTAELAAMRRTPAEAKAIMSHAKAMRQAGSDLAAQVEHDIAFHLAIADATRNPVFTLLIASFADLMRQTCPIGWRSRRTDADRQAMFDQHDRVAEAINVGDPVAAIRAMSAHFDISISALSNSGFN